MAGGDPVFTGPPVGRGVNRQPDLDVSPPPEPARWLFIRPVLPPFISHYETQLPGIRRGADCPETRAHFGSLVSRPRTRSRTPARVIRPEVGSGVTEYPEVGERFDYNGSWSFIGASVDSEPLERDAASNIVVALRYLRSNHAPRISTGNTFSNVSLATLSRISRTRRSTDYLSHHDCKINDKANRIHCIFAHVELKTPISLYRLI